MPDYVYLLENRLSPDQRAALQHVRAAARDAGMVLFLTGDAVRDLTSGHTVRELEIAVHGNARKLKPALEKLGGKLWGGDEATHSLYLCFPGTVRVDVVSTHRVDYPKPGKPVYHAASIQEDLRRRDFTANAMAISLNEGSFGLLMDPLNGVADIEARTLRLVSNYGFLEDPSLLIRAIRYKERLGWEMDPRTQTRYEDAKHEGVIDLLSADARSRELEQIGHEEEGLKVLRALEAESWMKVLFPAWTAAKADEEKLTALHDLAVELLLQGVHADMSAAQMQLLTARMAAKDLAALKKLMLRPGFVEEWNSLDTLAAGFSKTLLSKEHERASACYRLFTTYDPEAVLWLGFTSKSAAVQERYQRFLKVWPEAKQQIPYALMQEMRITPELANYAEIVHAVFLELIDGRLATPEEMRAFLEPYSPPAPPPPVSVKRSRAKRSAEAKIKERTFEEEDEEMEAPLGGDEDLDDLGGDDEIDLGLDVPLEDAEDEPDDEGEDLEDEDEAPAKSRKAAIVKAKAPATAPKKAAKAEPAPKPAAKAAVTATKAATPATKAAAQSTKTTAPATKTATPVAKAAAPAKKAAAPAPAKAKKAPAKPAAPVKAAVPAKAVKAAAKPAAKVPAKPAAKAVAKPVAKPVAKKAPAKAAPAKGKPSKPAPSAKAKPAAKKAPVKAGKKR